jgi:hypothetical protein
MSKLTAKARVPGLAFNHNQTLVRLDLGREINHNQTVARPVTGKDLNHNQTLVRR